MKEEIINYFFLIAEYLLMCWIYFKIFSIRVCLVDESESKFLV